MSCGRVPVRIGEVKVAQGGGVLCTIGLGSCVAIALYDSETRVGGLAHAMLPRPLRTRRPAPAGRFAITAVPELVERMLEHGADGARIRARLAGGASMFAALLPEYGLRLGLRNIEAAHEALVEAGIPLDSEEVGGEHGRSVFLDTGDGSLLITSALHPEVRL
jgi:chemotaxis protein CheD